MPVWREPDGTSCEESIAFRVHQNCDYPPTTRPGQFATGAGTAGAVSHLHAELVGIGIRPAFNTQNKNLTKGGSMRTFGNALGLLLTYLMCAVRRLTCRTVPQAVILLCTLPIWAANVRAQTQSQIVGAGYDIPGPSLAVAPGQVITLFVKRLNVPDARASSVPLPTMLSGVGVTVNPSIPNYPERLPILSLFSTDYCGGTTSCPLTYITVEIPTEPVGCVLSGLPNPCFVPSTVVLTVEVNGVAGQSFPVIITQSRPHIVNACDTIFGQTPSICYSLVQHADGTFVGSAGYPNGRLARPGETITFYAVGLGGTDPIVPTGEASPVSPLATIPSTALQLIVSYVLSIPPASPGPPIVWVPVGRWIYPSYIGLVPGYVGLYQVNVTLPPELAQAQPPPGSGSCLTVRIAIGAGDFGPSDGVSHVDLCVQP